MLLLLNPEVAVASGTEAVVLDVVPVIPPSMVESPTIIPPVVEEEVEVTLSVDLVAVTLCAEVCDVRGCADGSDVCLLVTWELVV